MSRDEVYWDHRTLCTVLDEMRDCYKTRNFAHILGLIEEAQSMGNRMEAALGQSKDLVKMDEEWHKLRKEIEKLREEKDKF
jgi:hypothetical protein